MKKVDLDLEFERWENDNIEHLQDKFNSIHNFSDFIEEAWQEYQQENQLIDNSNN